MYTFLIYRSCHSLALLQILIAVKIAKVRGVEVNMCKLIKMIITGVCFHEF